jgi:hypothetical protein
VSGCTETTDTAFFFFYMGGFKNYSAYNPTVTSSKGVVLNMPRIDFLF